MKVLIVSDSHLHLDGLIKIYDKVNPDAVICAGDHSKDCEELSFVRDKAEYYIVKGNCDYFDYGFEEELTLELCGKSIYVTHGHLYGVKRSYEQLKEAAKNLNREIVIFGHTHIPYYEEDKGIHYFNPGAARDNRYGVLEIDEASIKFSHHNL